MMPEDRDEGDRALLRNAVKFTTFHRAFAARQLLLPNLGDAPATVRRILALEAFQQYMLTAEDTLTWICAILEWEPHGAPDTSILAKLDTIQIGRSRRGDYSESTLLAKFDQLSVAEFRAGLKVPPDDQLHGRTDFPPSIEFPLDGPIGAWLAGLRRIVKGRLDQNRALVRAYNKAKHGLLGIFDTDLEGNPAVILLTAPNGYAAEPIKMNRTFVRALPIDIERRVNWTVAIAAVLQSILAFILGVHFAEWIETPSWATDALSLDAAWTP